MAFWGSSSATSSRMAAGGLWTSACDADSRCGMAAHLKHVITPVVFGDRLVRQVAVVQLAMGSRLPVVLCPCQMRLRTCGQDSRQARVLASPRESWRPTIRSVAPLAVMASPSSWLAVGVNVPAETADYVSREREKPSSGAPQDISKGQLTVRMSPCQAPKPAASSAAAPSCRKCLAPVKWFTKNCVSLEPLAQLFDVACRTT